MTSQRTRLRMVERLRTQGIKDERVLAVFAEVQRHIFVDEALAHRAYEDTALPIGFGQTISQPWVVAACSSSRARAPASTQCSRLDRMRLPGCLAIAPGAPCILCRAHSGAAHAGATQSARARDYQRALEARGRCIGLKASAPFDAIIMAAAATHVPDALLEQLGEGGRLVMPLGNREQFLTVITRAAEGFDRQTLDEVRFVPLLPGASG